MKIPRDEFIRQLREHGADLIEQWIAAALADYDFPAEFKIGGCFRFMLHYHPQPAPMRRALPPDNRVTCDALCGASIEFPLGVSVDEISATLARKGWRADDMGAAELLMCPRCRPASTCA